MLDLLNVVRRAASDPAQARAAWRRTAKCRGLVAASEGRLAAAIRLLETARHEVPWRDEEIEANLAELRTIRRLERRLEVAPNDAAAVLELGKAYFSQERSEEALAMFRRAIALAPGLAEAHALLGAELHWRGQVADAEAAYRAALRIDPRHVSAVLHYASLLRGGPLGAAFSYPDRPPTAAQAMDALRAVTAAMAGDERIKGECIKDLSA